jgi:hypothetical protein
MVELLVVILIISLLVALSAGAIMRFTTVQQKNNTQVILSKLAPILKVQWNAVTEQAYKEDIPATYVSSVQAISGTDPKRMRAVWIKMRQTQAFPMNFNEARNPSPLPCMPKYMSALSAQGITGSTGANYESAACLLLALQQGFGGGGFKPEDLGVSATLNFAAGTGSIPALVDGWGMPLAFVRWPKGSPDLNPTGATAGFNDPSDPEGTFAAASWYNSTTPNYASAFTTQFGFAPPGVGVSYKLMPIIVSAGPDQAITLDAFATPTTVADNDNISSATQ